MSSTLQSHLNHQEPSGENTPFAIASSSGLADRRFSRLLTPEAAQILHSLPGWCSPNFWSLASQPILRAKTMHTVHKLHNDVLPQVHCQHGDRFKFIAAENNDSAAQTPTAMGEIGVALRDPRTAHHRSHIGPHSPIQGLLTRPLAVDQ
jgi:hypothetical protein